MLWKETSQNHFWTLGVIFQSLWGLGFAPFCCWSAGAKVGQHWVACFNYHSISLICQVTVWQRFKVSVYFSEKSTLEMNPPPKQDSRTHIRKVKSLLFINSWMVAWTLFHKPASRMVDICNENSKCFGSACLSEKHQNPGCQHCVFLWQCPVSMVLGQWCSPQHPESYSASFFVVEIEPGDWFCASLRDFLLWCQKWPTVPS